MELYTSFSFPCLHAALCIADIQQPLRSECADGSLAQENGGVPPTCKPRPQAIICIGGKRQRVL